MSFLKKWASDELQAIPLDTRREETKLDVLPGDMLGAETQESSRRSRKDARRPVGNRLNEARELLGELTHLYNKRASALELAGLPNTEAERLAMLEVQATDTYRRWRALG
jgi:hypothetical protein